MLPVPIFRPWLDLNQSIMSSGLSWCLGFITRTSLGSCLSGVCANFKPGLIFVGISFRLCTAKSMVPSNSSLSISLTNRPLSPILSKDLSRILSPLVFIIFFSISKSGNLSKTRLIILSVCARAKALPLVPTINFIYYLQTYTTILFVFLFTYSYKEPYNGFIVKTLFLGSYLLQIKGLSTIYQLFYQLYINYLLVYHI